MTLALVAAEKNIKNVAVKPLNMITTHALNACQQSHLEARHGQQTLA